MNTKDMILHVGIILAVLVFLGSLGNIFYNHYVDREYHLEQLQILENLIEAGQDWTAVQKILEEKEYKIYLIHTGMENSEKTEQKKNQYYRCCWPLRNSPQNNTEITDYQVKMHYATHAIICVSPDHKVISCKGNTGSK